MLGGPLAYLPDRLTGLHVFQELATNSYAATFSDVDVFKNALPDSGIVITLELVLVSSVIAFGCSAQKNNYIPE